MLTLFDIKPDLPQGFSYKPGFLSPAEEQLLITEIETLELHHMKFHGYTANRKVASYGFDYSFETRQLTRGKDIPQAFQWLIEKVANELHIHPAAIAELLVTEYDKGTVINWHRDAPPFDMIIGVSLLSDCIFKLRPQEKARQTRSETIYIPVERRSLYIMKDEARSQWQHSISPVKSKRYSITLRTLKEGR